MTFIRQSIYPELIISLPVQELQRNWQPVQPDPTLTIGSQVRICSGSYEGAIGEIIYLYIQHQTFASGVRSRAARVRLEDGTTLAMPLRKNRLKDICLHLSPTQPFLNHKFMAVNNQQVLIDGF